jgi:hypothetical protein
VRSILAVVATLGLWAFGARADAPFWPHWTDLAGTSLVVGVDADPNLPFQLSVPPQRSTDGGKTYVPLPGFDAVKHVDRLISTFAGGSTVYLLANSPHAILRATIYRALRCVQGDDHEGGYRHDRCFG